MFRNRAYPLCAVLVLFPALAMCGDDEEGADVVPALADGGAVDGGGNDGGPPADGAATGDAIEGPDGSETIDSGDASFADVASDALTDVAADAAPSVLSYLAFCYQGFSGGLAAVYGIDDLTGSLIHVDQSAADAGIQDFPAGQNTIFSAVSPTRDALYCARSIASGIGPSLGAFSLSPTGTLSSLTSAAIAEQPVSVAVHPSGVAVYALGISTMAAGLYGFPVADGGGLAAGAYAGWAEHTNQVTVDRLGRFVFAAGTGTLWVHRTALANPATLTLASFHLKDGGGFESFYVGALGTAKRWAVHPSVDVIYAVFDGASDKLVAFRYDGATGVPSKVGEMAADNAPIALAVHPNGGHVYVVHTSSATVGHYTLASDGSLVGKTAIALPAPADAIAMDPTGKYLYVRTGTSLRGYAVSNSGGLTALATAPVSGAFTDDMATLPKPL